MKLLLLLTVPMQMLLSQTPSDEQTELLKTIVRRMDDLEKQNQELKAELDALRKQLSPAPLEERVVVNEHRIEEQAQTKVETSQKWPVTLNGLLLFNSFLNAGGTYTSLGAQSYPDLLTGPNISGATFRQTSIGLSFNGPQIFGGGKVSGMVSLDLSGGTNLYVGGIRLRRAGITVDWEHQTITAGQDKPLISQRSPDSLAEVAAPPLSGSGNLWLWVPQVRFEERHQLGAHNGITGQLAALQTAETFALVPATYTATLESTRPALEGRVAVWHSWGEASRIEIGAGAHTAQSHVAGTSVPSRIGAVDWLFQPWPWVKLTGTYFAGKNLAGIGGAYQAFTVIAQGKVRPVRGDGGWAQLAFPVTQRLTFNAYGGWQSTRDRDLTAGQLDGTNTYAGNVIFRLGPNLLLSFEAAQKHFDYFYQNRSNSIQNHYDVALGYAF